VSRRDSGDSYYTKEKRISAQIHGREYGSYIGGCNLATKALATSTTGQHFDQKQ